LLGARAQLNAEGVDDAFTQCLQLLRDEGCVVRMHSGKRVSRTRHRFAGAITAHHRPAFVVARHAGVEIPFVQAEFGGLEREAHARLADAQALLDRRAQHFVRGALRGDLQQRTLVGVIAAGLVVDGEQQAEALTLAVAQRGAAKTHQRECLQHVGKRV